MDLTKAILKLLKPKVKAYGFNKKELEGVAAKIADKLDLDEDASDEDRDAAIEKEIDAAIPYLQFSQSVSTRVINEFKKQNKPLEDDDDDDDDDRSAKGNKPDKEDKSTPAWAKSLLTTVQALINEVTALKSEKVTDTRRSKVEGILKGMGAFGESKLRDFSRMKFKDDEEFEEYVNNLNDDVKAINQERANAGLETLGAPGRSVEKKKPEELTDEEFNEMVNLM